MRLTMYASRIEIGYMFIVSGFVWDYAFERPFGKNKKIRT